MPRTTKPEKDTIAKQVKARVNAPKEKKAKFDGNTEVMISTGSTLLDLAISGGRVRGGGIPGGIMVEIFGPSGTGKTVLLCELGGYIQRAGGEVMFHDPEARMDENFAQIFELDTTKMEYRKPNTVTEMFGEMREWLPENKQINGVMADSLAALSTDMEMDEEEGDKMGMRRAKEFSEQLRKTARIITSSNMILACSNQLRETLNTFGPKFKSPGGEAIGYYASLRLRTSLVPKGAKLVKTEKYKGKDIKQTYGIQIEIEVFKSSVWVPHRTAPVTIDFGYGIDDIRENLKYLKKINGTSVYCVGDTKLDKSLANSIDMVEDEELADVLREEVIDTWEEIEDLFHVERKPKKR